MSGISFYLGRVFFRAFYSPIACGLILSLLRRDYHPLIFGLSWFVVSHASGFLIQVISNCFYARDSRVAVEILHKTHFLVRKSVPDFIKDFLKEAPQHNCEILVAVPRRAGERSALTTLKSYLNRGSFSLIILNNLSKTLSVTEKLFLLHEVGHISRVGYLTEFLTKRPLIIALLFYTPLTVLCANNWQMYLIGSVGLLEAFCAAGRYRLELVADWFSIWALLAEDGAGTTLRALSLLETKLKRTSKTGEDTEIETMARLKFVSDARKSIQDRHSLVSPEIFIGRGGAITLGLRIFSTIVVLMNPQMPSEKAIQLALSLIILSTGYSISGALLSRQLTRSAMETVALRSLPEEMFDIPENRDISLDF